MGFKTERKSEIYPAKKTAEIPADIYLAGLSPQDASNLEKLTEFVRGLKKLFPSSRFGLLMQEAIFSKEIIPLVLLSDSRKSSDLAKAGVMIRDFLNSQTGIYSTKTFPRLTTYSDNRTALDVRINNVNLDDHITWLRSLENPIEFSVLHRDRFSKPDRAINAQ